ncbi:leukotriene A-4 hydrolase-like [Belonocnema kinseyi]|uniref:leukotriene A-4 hydrolase-like n=1 Tax=Belonocnema kinseyi TaxID=2817044 RepID=UPI00143CE413|nr:leukotriene A-4 hydrolase-like [Belonocnema kinseyi]XP_033209581.1 leukotriene A-4 hydrolase-like [Belonocnema kinseyi]
MSKFSILLLFMFIFVARAFRNPKMALSPNDPTSFSRPDLVAVTNVHFQLFVNFEKKILQGHVILDAERKKPTNSLILDVQNLTLKSITNCKDDSKLEYTVEETVSFGSKLRIKLPNVPESEDGKTRYQIKIQYETSPKAPALQWLDPEQTSGGKYPYLFSQCVAIHARSMLPCQDTPGLTSTYSAEITAPKWARVLMSALHNGTKDVDPFSKLSTFYQPVPIPSYLIAIAVGSLVSKRIGPRSSVWAEKELIDQSASEFSETETMLRTAEEICGPYVWGVYDILVLPPSFAFGGMENPGLTFASPSLLAGDHFLTSVIAHEISHSWSGNLVAIANFEHFWLKEGLTVFLQFKIIGRMFGEKVRHFYALMGLSELKDALKSLSPEFTKLIVNLDGIDSDYAISNVPYMKGHTFHFYLEKLLGGPKEFEPFLKSYFETFKYKSIVTTDWKDYLYKYFSNKTQLLDSVDWDAWLNKLGMPPVIPNYNTDLLNACINLAKRWLSWDENTASNFEKSDIANLTAQQKLQFLSELFADEAVLSVRKMEKMQEVYDVDSVQNAKIRFMWIRLALKSRWEPKVEEALDFVTKHGGMSLIRPIYRDLYDWQEMRQRAIENYMKTKDKMMFVTAQMIKKDLHLDYN